MNQVKICKTIESGLKEANIAYGTAMDLWRISPEYFLIRKKQWDGGKTGLGFKPAVDAFVRFYLTVQQPSEPFYFRLDCAIVSKTRNVMLTEWNLVPVGEAGVASNRKLYTDIVPMPHNYYNPFLGNIDVLAEALRWYGGIVAIPIPSNRSKYINDYLRTAELLRNRGVDIWVERQVHLNRKQLCGSHGKIDLVFRIFPKSAMQNSEILQNGQEIELALQYGSVKLFPQFSILESKESMAWIFNPPPHLDSLITAGLREIVPWTWQTDPTQIPKKNWQTLCWWKYFMGEEPRRNGFVLKPCNSFGGRDIVFSIDVKRKTWREALGTALTNWESGKNIIQEMLNLQGFPMSYLDGDKVVTTNSPEWKTRFCVTGVWLPNKGAVIGDIDATLCAGTRLIHQQANCIFVPTLVEKDKEG